MGGMDPFGGSIFEAFGFGGFGGGRRRDEEAKTPNVVIPLRVSLKQLFTGDILEVSYVRQVLCLNHKECTKAAQDCHGPGVRVRMQQLAPGFMQQVQVRDEQCVARGKMWKKGCSACPKGQTQAEEATLTVDIQPGMKDGETIVFSEVADERAGHSAGDLVLQIQAIPHEYFVRQGDDLRVTLKVRAFGWCV
jgi:DnaJ-class molecular chaperone